MTTFTKITDKFRSEALSERDKGFRPYRLPTRRHHRFCDQWRLAGSNGLDGMRKCFEQEFSSIYVFNLRGNCRTSGELRRKEGDGVFGLGSRTPIAITILVKKGE